MDSFGLPFSAAQDSLVSHVGLEAITYCGPLHPSKVLDPVIRALL